MPVATHPPAFGSGSSASVPTEAPAAPATPVPPAAPVLRPAAQPSATAAVAQALNAPLRLAFVAGVTRSYTINLRTTVDAPLLAPGQPRMPASTTSLSVDYEVLLVDRDGSAVVRATVGTATGAGEARGDLSGTSVRVRLAPDGTYTDSQVERDGRLMARGADAQKVASGLMVFPYLNGPLYIGDSFEKRLQVSAGQAVPDTTVAVRYTLAEVTRQNGRELARIDAAGSVTSLSVPSSQGVEFSNGRAQVKGSDYVSTEDGWPTSGDSSMTIAFDAHSTDGRVTASLTARVDQSYRLEQAARGISV
jgi:hypothetical protein